MRMIMSRNRLLLIICAVLLAACGGTPSTPEPATPDPNAASVPTSDPNQIATPITPVATQAPREYATGQPPLPEPGTLVPPATEDPEAGRPFDIIEFQRTGGLEGGTLTAQILGNGSIIRNDAAGTITQEQVAQLTSIIDEIGFFGLEGTFSAPGTSADVFTYTITIERAGPNRTIVAQDGYIPDALMRLINALVEVSQPAAS